MKESSFASGKGLLENSNNDSKILKSSLSANSNFNLAVTIKDNDKTDLSAA